MTGGNTVSGTGWVFDAAEVAPADWPELLAADPAADYSHTRHWHHAICGSRPAARQLWLTARQNGQLLAGLGAVVAPTSGRLGRVLNIQRAESSIDGTSGGPLLHSAVAAADRARLFMALVNDFLARRPSGLTTATIALNPQSEREFGHLLQGEGAWRRQDSPTAMVSLAGGLEVVEQQRLVMNKRNERNRGLRRGAEVIVTKDADLLAAYYRIYAEASAHWGVVATPLEVLRDLLADPLDRVYFTCVRLGDQVIGGHLCLHLGARIFAWNGVTDPAYARTHFPATLCFWGDLVEGCRRQADWLDFGASGSVQSLAGFKRYFGAELMPRGFYVSDTPVLRVLRRVADLARRTGQGATRRWHDRVAAQARGGAHA